MALADLKYCSICGGNRFSLKEVLWPELVNEWQLSPYEVDYVNRQQGLVCDRCGNNLRSMALASGILRAYRYSGILEEFVESDVAEKLKVLEINNAGALTPVLSQINGHKLISYPEYDMENLKIDSSVYDLVVHSDTLEHINNPLDALTECKRILKPLGRCIFTVPVIVDRLSMSRSDKENSFHGDKTTGSDDLIVRTEFGCDVWKYVMQAGFSEVTLHCIDYPAGLAIEAI